jgi:hypothetical protein
VKRPSRETIDFSVYVRGFAVFARNPTVIVLPLLAGVCATLVNMISPVDGGGFIAGITLFIITLLKLFALGVSVIIADQGWRRGAASFDDGWQEARRKGSDIIMAAFGLTFILNIAQYAGTILGGTISLILLAIATYGLIYVIPAAAIGGIPGGAAINVSIERVRSAPMAAALLTVVTLVLFFYISGLVFPALIAALGVTSALIAVLIHVVIEAILMGYVAVVMAKVYNDVAFTAPRW